MSFNIDISAIPNGDQWITVAKDAANNPDDFSFWENFIQLTEFLPSLNFKTKFKVNAQSSTLEKQLVLLSYENTLINFPFLEQYWINYAHWFYKFNNLSNCIKTFKRALTILPKSLLIWNAYVDMQLKINVENDKMIEILEDALGAIGSHYFASSFFDKYLSFLNNNKLTREYHLLLRKIIEIPQFDYLKYFKLYFKLLENADLDTIKYFISKKDLISDFNLSWNDLLTDENFRKLKLEIKKKFLDLFITTQYYSWKFYMFEKNLSTHYFIPNEKLNRLELQTWRSYLEFVENMNLKVATKEKEISLIKNNSILIDTLYNRCLIPTCSYPFFWIKLSNYYLNYNDLDSAKSILLKGIYLNPLRNFKLRLRLIDLYIISTDFERAKCLVYELLHLLPENIQFYCKLLEIEHFILPSNVEKLILNKLSDISKLKNPELEDQFDYLFLEMLNYSCISLTKIDKIFDKFNHKSSPYYLKAKKTFHEFYTLDTPLSKAQNNINSDWSCEYF